VHEEAERLEHFISERLEERIAAKLGHPKIDPHGHCIPEMDGKMPEEYSIPLTQVAGKGTFVVDSISDGNTAIVKLLRTSGIVPGVHLQVRNRHVDDGYAVSIGRAGNVLHLSQEAADAIRIHRRP
jgi:DtxR family Mn-dependent transcriptional regulator